MRVKPSLRWVCESLVEEDLGVGDELKEEQRKNSGMERESENIHPWQRTERNSYANAKTHSPWPCPDFFFSKDEDGLRVTMTSAQGKTGECTQGPVKL